MLTLLEGLYDASVCENCSECVKAMFQADQLGNRKPLLERERSRETDPAYVSRLDAKLKDVKAELATLDSETE